MGYAPGVCWGSLRQGPLSFWRFLERLTAAPASSIQALWCLWITFEAYDCQCLWWTSGGPAAKLKSVETVNPNLLKLAVLIMWTHFNTSDFEDIKVSSDIFGDLGFVDDRFSIKKMKPGCFCAIFSGIGITTFFNNWVFSPNKISPPPKKYHLFQYHHYGPYFQACVLVSPPDIRGEDEPFLTSIFCN